MKVEQPLYCICPSLGREHGGLGTSCERIIQSLRPFTNLVVLTPDRDLPPGSYRKEESPGLTLLSFHLGGTGAESLQFLNDLILHQAESRAPAQILAFYAGGLSYAGALAARLLSVDFSLALRGNDIDRDVFGENAYFVEKSIAQAKTVFCLTQEQQRKVTAIRNDAPTKLIPNGVDPVFFPLLSQDNQRSPFILGIFGDLKEKKGLELLLQVISPEKEILHIVGHLREETKKILHAHQLLNPQSIPSILQKPYQKNIPDLLKEYSAVDLVCIPSHHEGMPNVLLEAMSCGKLVLASAVGGACDVIRNGENGFLFQARNPEDFRACLNAIEILSPEERKEISLRARQTICEHYSATQERDAYLQALRL